MTARMPKFFRIIATASGGTTAYFDSITEGMAGFEAIWSASGDTLRFEVPRIPATYEGTLNEARDSAEGRFQQGGREFALTLKNSNEAFKNFNVWENRSHGPKPPFPYTAEYALIQETINPLALETMGDWIVEHTPARD